jgi:cytoskeletal protein CcmA (bactofilin family)
MTLFEDVAETIIGKNDRIKGDLTFDKFMYIEGVVEGSIQANSEVSDCDWLKQ